MIRSRKWLFFHLFLFRRFVGTLVCISHNRLTRTPQMSPFKICTFKELAISKEFFCGDAKMSLYLNSPHNAAVSIFKSPKECRVNACMGGCVCVWFNWKQKEKAPKHKIELETEQNKTNLQSAAYPTEPMFSIKIEPRRYWNQPNWRALMKSLVKGLTDHWLYTL